MSKELKPCPFCGGEDLSSGGDDKIVGVWCNNCQATGPNHYDSRYDWNTRADLSDAKDKRIAELEAERDEQSDRIEELQQACEVVSSEFEGELWQSCRRILQKTGFDFHGADVDGVQAEAFESHINETLVEFDHAEARIADLEAVAAIGAQVMEGE